MGRALRTKSSRALPLQRGGLRLRTQEEPDSRSSPDELSEYEEDVEEFRACARAARERGDMRVALEFSSLKLKAMALRDEARAKKKASEPKADDEFVSWLTENLFALQAVKEALEAGTVTAEEIQGVLETKKRPLLEAVSDSENEALSRF